jgi:hypothetical protein
MDRIHYKSLGHHHTATPTGFPLGKEKTRHHQPDDEMQVAELVILLISIFLVQLVQVIHATIGKFCQMGKWRFSISTLLIENHSKLSTTTV